MNKNFYVLIEYIRQLNLYFDEQYDIDCILYCDVNITWYNFSIEVNTNVNNREFKYDFDMHSDGLCYLNDNDTQVSLEFIAFNIFQLAFKIYDWCNQNFDDVENMFDVEKQHFTECLQLLEKSKNILNNQTF